MSKRSKSGSGTDTLTKALAGLFVLVLVVGGLNYFGVIVLPWRIEDSDPGPGPGPTRDTPSTYDTAIVTSDVAAWDSLDISTARTIGSDINVLWFRYSGGWIKLASGDAADLTMGARAPSPIGGTAPQGMAQRGSRSNNSA